MITLTPTTMPRPMEWSVRMVGYAQMEGDSRDPGGESAGLHPGQEILSCVGVERRRLLFFRQAAARQ